MGWHDAACSRVLAGEVVRSVASLGGMQDPKHRNASSELLLALLEVCYESSVGDLCFMVSLQEKRDIIWPRSDDTKRALP